MNRKRDLIEEIQLVKSRIHGYYSRWYYLNDLTNTKDYYYEIFQNNTISVSQGKEIAKYLPIATVACFESFFRRAVKDVIDFGSPYYENLKDFNQTKNVKLDFDVITAVQSKTFTIGEFVGHILPYNNLQDINSNLSTLLKEDFLEELGKFSYEVYEDGKIKVEDTYIKNKGKILESIYRTYELRHIFCHEFSTTIDIQVQELFDNLRKCIVFLNQVHSYFETKLNEINFEDTVDHLEYFVARYNLANQELDNLIDLIKKLNGERDFAMESFINQDFDDNIKVWRKYRENYGKFKSKLEKGTTKSVFYYSALLKATSEKIKSLEEEYALELKYYSNVDKYKKL